MSHEIRTPMNAVLGYAQLLLRATNLEETQRRQVETIHQSGSHLLVLINDILEMSKIEAGRMKLHFDSMDLHSTLRDVERMFQQLVRDKGLELGLHFDKDLVRYVEADATKVRQILINLLSNAQKFTPRGRIDIHARSERREGRVRRITLAVRDTGIGIEPERQEQIFDAFEQTATGSLEGGTGLGMAISRSYARLMGGELTVESEPGRGSTFTLEFDAMPSKRTSSDYPVGLPRLIAGQGSPRILVVDDVETNRDLAEAILSASGFTVLLAESGEVAIEHAGQVDLILIDLRMPGIGGTEAIRQIRDTGNPVPIIAVTASVGVGDRQKALSLGAQSVLLKPYLDVELLVVVVETLGLEYELVPEVSNRPPEVESRASEVPDESVPDGLRARLIETILAAQIDEALAILAELASSAPALASALRACLDQFDYDAALAMLHGDDA